MTNGLEVDVRFGFSPEASVIVDDVFSPKPSVKGESLEIEIHVSFW